MELAEHAVIADIRRVIVDVSCFMLVGERCAHNVFTKRSSFPLIRFGPRLCSRSSSCRMLATVDVGARLCRVGARAAAAAARCERRRNVNETPDPTHGAISFRTVHLPHTHTHTIIIFSNKMTLSNLGVVFGPALIRADTDGLDMVSSSRR